MNPRPPSNGFPSPAGDDHRGESVACPEWEAVLVEIARAGAHVASAQPGPEESAAALQHVTACAACRLRLAAERAASEELEVLALADAMVRPSPACEAAVMSAFRAERGREVRSRRWIFAVAGTIAASLLILLGAALLVSRDSGTLARAVLSRLPVFAGGRAGSIAVPDSAIQETAEDFSAASDGEEEFTDFYAFYPGADLSSVDSGALVRVRVPRSELAAFGLSVVQDQEDDWVNAELLVAEDGSPQAIRFVMPAAQNSRN